MTVTGQAPPSELVLAHAVDAAHDVLVAAQQEGIAPPPQPLQVRIVYSCVLMGASMLTAATLRDVTTVWGLLGSTAAVLLALVFPSLAYVWLRETPTSRPSTVFRRKLVACAIVGLGLLVIPVGLSLAVRQMLTPASGFAE